MGYSLTSLPKWLMRKAKNCVAERQAIESEERLIDGDSQEQVDLDDRFGDKCGKPMKSFVRVNPGPNSNRNGVSNQRSSAAQTAAYTKNALHERGENLINVAQQTEQLDINAQEYARRSFMLKEKYEKKSEKKKKKKWYQF
uniref:V-SNARE coiled-coil homology domain-containing protein n=1 Tax=Plectus sambesii TaxID=2011161 RepID=A0A914W925_9BILA